MFEIADRLFLFSKPFCFLPGSKSYLCTPVLNNLKVLRNYLSLIKFSHTIFALPFALLGFFLAYLQGSSPFSLRLLLLVLACMVFARTAAMAFNRYLDRRFDSLNPRTRFREIPAGIVTPGSALTLVIGSSLMFVFCTWLINPLCLALSPVALAVILGYSYTKRFTALCHLVLGLGLSLAPIGAYLALAGRFDWLPLLYSAAVLCWVSGFDIIYALQDEEFDKAHQLHSLPALFGKAGALNLSVLLHLLCGLFLFSAVYLESALYPEFGWLHWLAAAFFADLLVYQHTLVRPDDLSRVGLAFATTNGIGSVVFSVLVILDIFI